MRRRRKEYKGGGLHTGAKDCRARLGGGRGERARPEGDLKLKLPRFRLDEFISLAGKIACGTPRTIASRFLWTKWRSFDFATKDFLHSLMSLLKYEMHPKIISLRNLPSSTSF